MAWVFILCIYKSKTVFKKGKKINKERLAREGEKGKGPTAFLRSCHFGMLGTVSIKKWGIYIEGIRPAKTADIFPQLISEGIKRGNDYNVHMLA